MCVALPAPALLEWVFPGWFPFPRAAQGNHVAHDPWLDRWLPSLKERAGAQAVLEIGCGAGQDTETLVAAGLKVVAFDLSDEKVEKARLRVPGAEIHRRSVLEQFPLEGSGIPVVIASLSLHYFAWQQTLSVFDRMRNTLAPAGLLLCRLNSTEDRNFGAAGHPEIEPHYYAVNGEPKRFFDRADVDALFARGWQVLSIEHGYTGKYGAMKAFWEVAAERAA